MSESGVIGRYRTIVVDPPWPGSRLTPQVQISPICLNCGGSKYHGRRKRLCDCAVPRWDDRRVPRLPYPTMAVQEIAALPISDLADTDAHLYLWTTQRFLRDAFDLMAARRFRLSTVLVWSKPPKGFGVPFVASAEFVIFARRGALRTTGVQMGTVFNWPRPEDQHSAKPDAFLDLVERVSPGPYAELFARRARFGWSYPIGDEALGGIAA